MTLRSAGEGTSVRTKGAGRAALLVLRGSRHRVWRVRADGLGVWVVEERTEGKRLDNVQQARA